MVPQAIVGDAEIWCLPCAEKRWGESVIEELITNIRGLAEKLGNRYEIQVLYEDSPDLHGQYCANREFHIEPLCGICYDSQQCYHPGQYDFYNRYGGLREEIAPDVGYWYETEGGFHALIRESLEEGKTFCGTLYASNEEDPAMEFIFWDAYGYNKEGSYHLTKELYPEEDAHES